MKTEIGGCHGGTAGAGGLAIAALIAGTLLVTAALLVLSVDPRWAGHLAWDVRRYGRYAAAFLASGSWTAVPQAEYQPGALWLFLVPSPLVALGVPYELGMRLLQAMFVVLHVPLLLRLGGKRAAWAGLALFLAAGPIALYRFEPFVSLLVLVALAEFQSSRPGVCGVALGLAGITKLYPFLLVPVFAAQLWARAGGRGLGRLALGVAAGVAVPLAGYLMMGGSLGAFLSALGYHAGKAVAVQSLLGTLVLLDGLVRGTPLVPIHDHAMHGLAVARGLQVGTNALALGAVVAIWYEAWRERGAADGGMRLTVHASAVALTIAIVPTPFQPQYLLWPLALVALLPTAARGRLGAVTVGLFGTALVAMQVAFPLNYTELLALFYERRMSPLPHCASVFSMGAAVAAVAIVLWNALRPLLPAKHAAPGGT